MDTPAKLPVVDSKSGVVHLRALTGLRFFAAFCVFAFHLQGYLWPQMYAWNLGSPAVSFFFVLSGFILTYVYQDRLTWSGTPRFLFSRFARLWPLHIVCLLIAGLVLNAWPDRTWEGGNSWFSYLLNIVLLQSWPPGTYWGMGFNAVAWSISVELFFYCCFPFLLLLTGKRVIGWPDVLVLLAAIGIVIGMERVIQNGAMPAWCNADIFSVTFPPLRLFEFALGMVTCRFMVAFQSSANSKTKAARRTDGVQLVSDTLWEIVSIGAIVLLGVWCHVDKIPHLIYTSEWGGKMYAIWFRVSGFSPLFAFAIYTFATGRGLLSRFLSTRFMVWMGEISFALYLIHQVVILKLNQLTLSDNQFIFLSLGISMFAAAVLYATIEMPSRRFWLAVYDRKAGKWAGAFSMLWQYMKTGWGKLQIACLVGMLAMVWMHPNEQATKDLVDEIVQATPDGSRYVHFYQEGYLMGFDAKVVPRGVQLRMAWVLERTAERQRFIHICDADGNILGQGKFDRKLFASAQANVYFVEDIVLSKRQLKGGAYLAVGFWSKDLYFSQSQHPKIGPNGLKMKVADLIELRGLIE